MVVGVVLTALVFSSTERAWELSPTITTMESTTRPVSELPFPAVTVCPDRDTHVDNVALMEKILNRAAFDCYDGGCEELGGIREDFFLYVLGLVEKLYQR